MESDYNQYKDAQAYFLTKLSETLELSLPTDKDVVLFLLAFRTKIVFGQAELQGFQQQFVDESLKTLYERLGLEYE